MKLLSITEAAKLRRQHPSTLRLAVKNGELPALRRKPYILIDAAMLRKFPIRSVGRQWSTKPKGGK